MRDLRLGHVATKNWRAGIGPCVAQLGHMTPAHRLGFLYATDYFADELDEIASALRGATAVQDWVGTVGIGICATGREYFDEPALCALVAAAGPEEYRLMPLLQKDLGPLMAAHGAWLAANKPGLALVHADPRAVPVAELVRAIARETGFVVGGLACSRGAMPVLAGTAGEGGVSGVVFAPGVSVATGLSQGCSPIGPVRTVTAAERNVIVEIDGRPALDVFKKDIGELLARDLRRVAGYIHAALPVAGSDTGDYTVRNLAGIDPKRGWIAIGAEVSSGDPILFVRRDRQGAEQDLDRMLAQLSARAKGRAQGGIYVSCVARGRNMFGEDSAELGRIRKALGDIPIAGFYANGEISNDRLYGYTGVLTLFLA